MKRTLPVSQLLSTVLKQQNPEAWTPVSATPDKSSRSRDWLLVWLNIQATENDYPSGSASSHFVTLCNASSAITTAGIGSALLSANPSASHQTPVVIVENPDVSHLLSDIVKCTLQLLFACKWSQSGKKPSIWWMFADPQTKINKINPCCRFWWTNRWEWSMETIVIRIQIPVSDAPAKDCAYLVSKT